jgi:hydroxymethylglutaryl-CoA reductase
MKMHLLNILNQFEASETQKKTALLYFKTEPVTVQAVGAFLQKNSL